MFKKYKPFIQTVLLLATIIAFVLYYQSNSSDFARISTLSFSQVMLIIAGQLVMFAGNVLVIVAIGRFFSKTIHVSEAVSIGAYSSIVNFFGFLQGGLGVRGVYLKQKHAISLKKYFVVTALQYVILFCLAGLFICLGYMLLHGIGVIECIALGIVCLVMGLGIVFREQLAATGRISTIMKRTWFLLQPRPIMLLAMALIVYLSGGLLTYGTELRAVGPQLSVGGLLIYTGVTQFSIIIALTPGGIGVREALLLIAAQPMLLSASDIVVASTIDRALYFVTLGLLLPLTVGAKRLLQKGKARP